MIPINFYSHTKSSDSDIDLRVFSNLYANKVIVNDEFKLLWNILRPNTKCPDSFPSTENAYQSIKPYENKQISLLIAEKVEPLDAAKIGQGRFRPKGGFAKYLMVNNINLEFGVKPKINENDLIKFNDLTQQIMMELLRSKFVEDSYEGKILLSFRDRYDKILFVEHTENDGIWGDKLNGTGMNMLGKLLTIRLGELINNKIQALDIDYLKKPNNLFIKYD